MVGVNRQSHETVCVYPRVPVSKVRLNDCFFCGEVTRNKDRGQITKGLMRRRLGPNLACNGEPSKSLKQGNGWLHLLAW